jgi:hypothetical protein
LPLNTRLLPAFETLCCGAELMSEWRTLAPLRCRLDLGGGVFGGVPDRFTPQAVWEWADCDGTPRRQRVTSLAAWLPEKMPESSLQLKVEWQGRSRGSVQLRAVQGVSLAVLSHGVAAMAKASVSEIESEHIAATLAACEPLAGPPNPIFPARVIQQCKGPIASARKSSRRMSASDRKKELQIAAACDVGTAVNIFYNGTPHCSLRVMRETD